MNQSFIRVHVTPSVGNLDTAVQAMEDAGFGVLDHAIREITDGIQQDMMVEGMDVFHPIRWDSERQRKAYFATNGFGAGIPYVRTGGEAGAWISAGYTQERMTSWSAYTQSDVSIYIRGDKQGKHQSHIHSITWSKFADSVTIRWRQFQNSLDALRERIADAMRNSRGQQ